MNPLPIDPWNFELPEYLLRVCVAPTDLHPHYATVDALRDFGDQYYRDDRQITGAALPLHPLLGTEAQAAVYNVLSGMHDWSSGMRFTELGECTDPAIHLLIRGRARLVATLCARGRERRWVVAQYGTGQWIGLPHLLREYDRTARSWAAWPDGRLRLEAEALGPVRTQCVTLDDARSLVSGSPDFRRFVEHHVAVRFARRREMLRRVDENPLLRLLSPAEREYLMQLGAIVAVGGGVSDPYLPAGPPTGRAALLLRGEGALVSGTGDVRRYVATLRSGDLVGHEGLVMDAERRDPPADRFDIVEPPRTTEVRLAPETQVLQFYWYALRWVLDDRATVWERVKRILSGDPADMTEPMPTIVSFHAARAGLGTTVLACGTGAELARSGGRSVKVIDLQGPENFTARWEARGFAVKDATVPLEVGPRMLRAEGRRTTLDCHVLVPPPDAAWPPGLEIVWPVATDPGAVEDLVDALEMGESVSHVVVAGSDDEGGLMSQVLDRLHGRCSEVFFVCDDADTAYPRVEPEHLTWVYRMTPEYRASEVRHARRVRFVWLFAGVIGATSAPVHDVIERMLGYSPSAELERESVGRPRRTVRVPDDPIGAQIVDLGGLAKLVGPDAQRVALGRAVARLARVVNRRTVGLALGGGGAWGFSHVALLRNLEAQGVPIDYIAGTSFGAVVGGLYAAGGMRALEQLVDENSATGRGIGPTLRAIAGGSLNRALFVAPFSSVAVETFVHGELRAAGAGADDPLCLGTTEIPFYPVGTNLGTHELLALPHATVGWGVRMSGSLPPIFSTLLRGDDRIADGAFIANVPSRVVREVGAHFVIAANVVPPPPLSTPTSFDVRSLVTWLPRKIVERLEDSVRGLFVLAWKAGEDQGTLAADYRLDLRPKAANLFEMWRGRDIVEQIETNHFKGANEPRIREAWDRFRGNGSRATRRTVD